MLVWLFWGHWRAIKFLRIFRVLIDFPQVCFTGHKVQHVSRGICLNVSAECPNSSYYALGVLTQQRQNSDVHIKRLPELKCACYILSNLQCKWVFYLFQSMFCLFCLEPRWLQQGHSVNLSLWRPLRLTISFVPCFLWRKAAIYFHVEVCRVYFYHCSSARQANLMFVYEEFGLHS